MCEILASYCNLETQPNVYFLDLKPSVKWDLPQQQQLQSGKILPQKHQ